jgi:hypothetical protein
MPSIMSAKASWTERSELSNSVSFSFGGDEAPRDRGLGVAFGDLLELFADGLRDEGVAPGGHACEHPFDGDLGEEVPVAEQRIRVEGDLAAFGLGRTRAPDGHAATAEHDGARCGAVTSRDSLGVVAALRADLVGELGLHELGDDGESGRAAERHQAVLDRLGDILQLQGDGGLGWQFSEARGLVPVRDGHDR